MSWAGDQTVDWTASDGLPSSVIAALSLAVSGMGLSHSDIGTEIHILVDKLLKNISEQERMLSFSREGVCFHVYCTNVAAQERVFAVYHTGLYGVR